MEEWRPVNGFEGWYEVSNLGRVRSLYRYHKILHPHRVNNGYMQVNLFRDHSDKGNFLVHRLVAIAFLPNPHKHPVVNHKDEDPSNNEAANLEWCTHQYNNTYGTKLQRQRAHTDYAKRKINNANQILALSKPIVQTSNDGTVKVWNSAAECARTLGYKTASSISAVCRGKRKRAYGCNFAYLDKEARI